MEHKLSTLNRTNRFQFETLEDRRLLAAAPFFDANDLDVACCDFPVSDQAEFATSLLSYDAAGPKLDRSTETTSFLAKASASTASMGSQHLPAPEASSQEFVAQDIAGGTVRSAYEIGELNRVVNFSDSVSTTDRVDMFQFQLSQNSSIAIDLTGLSDDADLYLMNSSQQLVSRSVNSRSASEEITANLDAGEYYLLVYAYDDSATEYELQLSGTAKNSDDAGNFFAFASDLGILDSTAIINESVGGNDPRDFYRFSVEQDSSVAVSVGNLSANVTLLIYDSERNLVVRSSNSRLQDELAEFEAEAGEYFIRVNQAKGFVTDYRMDIDVSPADGRFDDVPDYGDSNDWNLNAINAPEVWAAGYTGDGVTVAVIDTGVDYEHSDLVNSLWVNVDEVAGNGIDDDGNGFVDDYYGWDFVDSDASPIDENGHGTHVAGTIGAARNGFGVTGVAYGSSIMSIRVLDEDGSGFYSDVAAGVYYAVNNGADIINLSLGGPPGSSLYTALQYAESNGVLIVSAAGNEASSVPTFPASYSSSLTNVISVGAYDSSQTIASFSNSVGGSNAIQVDAPGVNIASTYTNDRYARLNGTSMATPHVAGLAALIIDANQDLDPQSIRDIIVTGAVDSIDQSDSVGGIDAARSVYIAATLGGQASSNASQFTSSAFSSNGFPTTLSQSQDDDGDAVCSINIRNVGNEVRSTEVRQTEQRYPHKPQPPSETSV